MKLSGREIIESIDLSAVRASDGEKSLQDLARCAKKYHCKHVTALPSQTELAIDLLHDSPQVIVAGNVGFPSGGQTTTIKVLEAQELMQMGCRELDMVLNIGQLISGNIQIVFEDILAVVDMVGKIPVKVILECHYLTDTQILTGCDLCIKAGAAFIKTSTGWAPSGATVNNVTLIKQHVGDSIAIKAAGGVRSLDNLLSLYGCGARRFGIGLRWATSILEQCVTLPDGMLEF